MSVEPTNENQRAAGVVLHRLVRARVHRVGVFGLGFAGERVGITDHKAGYYWSEVSVKIYLGPWMVNLHFPITRLREVPF